MQILNPSSGQNSNKTEGYSFYPLTRPSRSLISLSTNNQNKHRFAVGSFENSESNNIILVDFDEESFTFSHLTLANNLLPVNHLLDFYSNEKVTQLLVSFKDPSEKSSFLSVLTLDLEKAKYSRNSNTGNRINKTFDNISRLSVDPHSSPESNRLSVVTRNNLHVFHNFEEVLTFSSSRDSVDRYSRSFFTGRFDPHNKDLFAISRDNYFEVLDFRQDSKKRVSVKSSPYHKGAVLDLGFNPNLPNELATTGEDTLVLFWDLRNTHRPLSSFETGHGHWVKRVEYNSFQDQLVLSCGSGGSFLHWRKDTFEKVTEKTNNCYDICWSYDDAWFYCALLQDGLRVEMVPKSVKNTLLS